MSERIHSSQLVEKTFAPLAFSSFSKKIFGIVATAAFLFLLSVQPVAGQSQATKRQKEANAKQEQLKKEQAKAEEKGRKRHLKIQDKATRKRMKKTAKKSKKLNKPKRKK
jgi:Flp pilus assembly protein TadB